MPFLDINECTVSNGGCSHKCVNTAGGYKCECSDPELSLALDNKTCHGKCGLKKHSNTTKTRVISLCVEFLTFQIALSTHNLTLFYMITPSHQFQVL